MTGTRWRAAILSTLLIAAPFTNAPATGQQESGTASPQPIPGHEVLEYASSGD